MKTLEKNSRAESPSPERTHVRQSLPCFNTENGPATSILQALGNQAMQRLLRSGTIQAELKVGRPGDVHEQEADRVATHIVSGQPVEAAHGKCAACASSAGAPCSKCAEHKIQPKMDTGNSSHADLRSLSRISSRGRGQQLPDSVRSFFEPRFGYNFSDVRIHDHPQGETVNEQLSARAFTYGRDIVFAAGQYAPETTAGRKLLAHELTHVIQQAGGQRSSDQETHGRTIGPAATQLQGDGELSDQDVAVIRQWLGSDAPRPAPNQLVDTTPTFFAPRPRRLDDDQWTNSFELRNGRWLPRNGLQGPEICNVGCHQTRRDVLEARLRREEDARWAQRLQELAPAIAAFKQLVLSVARLRLASNRSNLSRWRAIVERLQLDTPQERLTMQVAQLQEAAEHSPRTEALLQRGLAVRNPVERELVLGQVEGRYRACTGCHLALYAQRVERETPEWQRIGPEWRPLADRLTGADDRDRPILAPWLASVPQSRSPVGNTATQSVVQRTTPPTVGSGPVAERTPSPAQMQRINAMTESYRAIIGALGPQGYKVWEDSAVSWQSPDIEVVRRGILERIDQRMSDYLELMTMISNGEREYKEFEPILQELLSTAGPDLQRAIREELAADANRNFWETIVIGVATLGALLLTIFPPTTALGVTALAALEVALGVHAAATGIEMMEQAYAYGLTEGTTGIYSAEQQQSRGVLMFMGFISVVTAPLMIGTGTLRGVGAGGRMLEGGTLAEIRASEALTRGTETIFGTGEAVSLGPGTVQRGRLVLSYEADGTVVGAVSGEPNVMMIAREGEAVMYQRTADGGLEAVQRMRLPEGGSVGGGGGGGAHLPGGGGGGTAQPTIMEPFVGPSLESPTELMSRYPGSNVIAAEGRFFPPAPEIEAFAQRGGQFIPERFPSSIRPGELQQIHVRYPLPHQKGLENISVDFMTELRRSPGMDTSQLLTRLEGNIESVNNLGPYALERLAPNGTMEIIFYETEVAEEIASLTNRIYTDAATGTRYTFEIVQAPTSVPRSIAPFSGYGIPSRVETVSQAVVRKVLAP